MCIQKTQNTFIYTDIAANTFKCDNWCNNLAGSEMRIGINGLERGGGGGGDTNSQSSSFSTWHTHKTQIPNAPTVSSSLAPFIAQLRIILIPSIFCGAFVTHSLCASALRRLCTLQGWGRKRYFKFKITIYCPLLFFPSYGQERKEVLHQRCFLKVSFPTLAACNT